MRSFWLWFAFMIAAWIGSIYDTWPHEGVPDIRVLLSACFMAAYFLVPLFRHRPAVMAALFGIAPILAAGAHWPTAEQPFNPYLLIILSLIAGEAVYRLPLKLAAIAGGTAILSAVAAPFSAGVTGFPLPFTLLYAVILTAAMIFFHTIVTKLNAAEARNEALLSEYRRIKRRQLTDEEEARQEARAQVARDIHDSVGHKLTALLMQLEVHRLQASDEAKPMLEGLKELAKESLEETRNAVKAMKQEETGGLQAVLALIRRLEAESFLRIQFTVKDGALSTPLTNEQSIAIYRAVQEALTNAMRHSRSKTAEVLFEAPGGGSVFRFEVANEQKRAALPPSEGFGLRSMRERIAAAGGQLEVASYENQFIVRGTFALNRGEIE